MAYYVVASRLNSISNNDGNNNSWDYKLNDGVVLPAGTTVEVINAYINKQGITNDSIEFTEDVSETFEIGFTVPQTAMFQQKPERTAVDDRLTTASLEDPSGSLGLQTPEISIPLTNYYDCMVQHNPINSDGLNIFNSHIGTSTIASLTATGNKLNMVLEGNMITRIGVSMPIVIKDLVKNTPLASPYVMGVQADFCRCYSTVNSVAYDGVSRTTVVLDTLGDKLTSDTGLYTSNITGNGGLYFPNVVNPIYSQCSGLAFSNSLVGTKEDGDTLYRQTRLGKPNLAWEGADPVPALSSQILGLNYQAGINSDIVSEEFRSHTADYSRDPVWNMSQTGVSAYQFDRGSYSFYFGPTYIDYDFTSRVLDCKPATEINKFDFENYKYGPNGHSVRLNANGLTIVPTGKNNARTNYTSEYGVSPVITNKYYPYIDNIPNTEYPNRGDLSCPKGSQPAKFKDYNAPQVDYLRDGFSWDKAPMRCEIFTQHGMTMIETSGAQNPFQPYIYGGQSDIAAVQTDLSNIKATTFLDRVLLTQSMVQGMTQREDSYPYVKRNISFQNNIPTAQQRIRFREGDIMFGIINEIDQTTEVRNRLFPSKKYRGDLDSSFYSTQNIYNTTLIEIPVMIVSMVNEGTSTAALTELQPISNLDLRGAIINGFTYIYQQPVSNILVEGNVNTATFSDFEPYLTEGVGSGELQIQVDGESWEFQTPQYIPMFSAKGAFSDLNGDNQKESKASDQDIDLGAGNKCRMNYFIDSNHDQVYLDYLKMVGEDFALNPNYLQNFNNYNGYQSERVCSHPYFNHESTDSGLREDFTRNKRILIQQRGNSKYGGIHPRRVLKNPISTDAGLCNSFQNFGEIPTANYMFGTTRHCSLGSMRPPTDRNFENGSQVVMSEPLNAQNEPVVVNNGIEDFATVLQNFDPDNENNSLKLKVIEERSARTVIDGIFPNAKRGTHIPTTQLDPFGNLNFDHNPNCSSALGEFESWNYSTPETTQLDTGGSCDPLCLVQLQAIEENYSYNRNDYVLRPLTSEINIEIPMGTYSIAGFLDVFNTQIKDIDKNDKEQLSALSNFKTVRRFDPLGGLAIIGGQVSLLSDFLEETHNRTIYSTDETSEFVKNPLVIAIRTSDYNDLVRAWQTCGSAMAVSQWVKAGEVPTNSKLTEQNLEILGGSYVWYNFRDLNYWSEFVDKYPDSVENIISATEQDDITNFDTQFYFSRHENLDDASAVAFTYGARASLGIGSNLVPPLVDFNNSSTDGQFKITGNVEAKIDKLRKFNPVVKGIYVGSPNFQLSYNPDQNLFSLSDLHFAYRNPTMDLIGESAFPDNAIDQPAVLYRTLSQLITGNYEIAGTNFSPPDYILNALQSPQDQISGVFVYNMSKDVAISDGDFIDENSVLIGRTFNDYFSNSSVAKKAWAKTLWKRLGFSYETFNTFKNNTFCSYYLNPTDDITNTENPQSLQSDLFKTTFSSTIPTVKNRVRQALCSSLTDGSVFNDVSRNVQDNYLSGPTTGSLFDIRAIPQVASSQGTEEGQNNTIVRLYNNASISSTRSMSGGYVYYPIRLGNLNEFDGGVNYTAMNIHSQGDGYVYHSPKQGTTRITSKSAKAIPFADQLIQDRPYQFQNPFVPGYFPYSHYRTTYSQPISGTDYPVEYEMDNFGFGRFGSFVLPQESQFNLSNGVFRDRDFTLQGSMFLATQSTPILADSGDIVASSLPILTSQGFFIITSDIISNADSIKGNEQMPILGTIPISSLSSQDFITSFDGMPHTLTQSRTLNSIQIKVLNPDLTPPKLEPDSTIILQITPPAGTPQLGLPTTPPPSSGKKNTEREMVGEVK